MSDKKEKEFDINEFYRKLGVGLLVLLLIIIIIFGSIMLIIQNQILKQTHPKFIEKNKVQILDTNREEDLLNSYE